MQASLERLESNQIALQVEVPVEQVDEALGKAYYRVVKRINIPGFRKGRVPRSILEARMGKEVLYEDALDILVLQAYQDAVKEHDIEPISKPEMDVIQMEQGKPLIFKVKVEVLPEVKLGEYKGIEAEMPEVKVGDDEVEAHLQMLQQRHARLIDAGEEPASDGDIAVVDYEAAIDGKPEPRLAGKERSIEIGTHKFIPGFDAHLLDAKAGQELEFTLQLPSMFQVSELAEKEAQFKVKVTGVKHKELSLIDDEFARDISDCTTLDEFKVQIKNKLDEVGNYNAKRIFAERVVNQVVAQAEVEPPASLVEEQLQQEYGEFARNLSSQKLDLDTYLHLVKKEPEALKADLEARAREVVKGRLVFSAIAKAEGLKIAPEELEQEVSDTAAQYGMESAKLRKTLEDKGQLGAFEKGLLLDKVQKFLSDNAKAVPPKPVEEPSAAPQAGTAQVQEAAETAASQPEAAGEVSADNS
ncbi:MAG: trigger factor [Thermacetogeniaceae bacterium]